LFELQNHDGPCLDAYNTGVLTVSDDLTREQRRWPTFAPRAVEVGYRAVLSVPLKLRNQIIGALNLLRTDPGSLTERDARVLRGLADIATVGVLQERIITQTAVNASGLQTALTSRIRIEQAKGVLAERHSLNVDDAFDALRTYARNNGLRLTDVATSVVDRSIDIPPRLPRASGSPPE